MEGYGQTECHAVCSVTLVGDPDTGMLKKCLRTRFNKPPITHPSTFNFIFYEIGADRKYFWNCVFTKKGALWPSKPHSVTADCSTCVTMLWQCSATVPARPIWCHSCWLGHWSRIWEGSPQGTLYPGSGDFPRSQEKHEVSVCCFQGRSCQSTVTYGMEDVYIPGLYILDKIVVFKLCIICGCLSWSFKL